MLLLVLSLFISTPLMAQDWDASLTALVHTTVGQVAISGEANIPSLEKPTLAHSNSIFIPSVTVPVSDLSANIYGVMPVLRRPNFFDASRFPEITVNNVSIFSNGLVNGTVEIKGNSKLAFGSWKVLQSGRIQIDFSIHLSDFNIQRRVMFFGIDDLAKVRVEMDNPF